MAENRSSPNVIHVTGLPGSGKSTLAAVLSTRLGLPWRSIDHERVDLLLPGRSWPKKDYVAWNRLRVWLEAAGSSIVETAGTSRSLGRLLANCRVLTIVVTVDEQVRRGRIDARSRSGHPLVGNPIRYLAAISRVAPPPPGDMAWDGALDPHTDAADQLCNDIRSWGRRGT